MPGGPVRVTFDMMTKGSVQVRGRKKVRQFAVMVGASIRLVTSGDMVDHETYQALLAAAAVRPEEASPDGVNGG